MLGYVLGLDWRTPMLEGSDDDDDDDWTVEFDLDQDTKPFPPPLKAVSEVFCYVCGNRKAFVRLAAGHPVCKMCRETLTHV